MTALINGRAKGFPSMLSQIRDSIDVAASMAGVPAIIHDTAESIDVAAIVDSAHSHAEADCAPRDEEGPETDGGVDLDDECGRSDEY
jgi:hypothetical protein